MTHTQQVTSVESLRPTPPSARPSAESAGSGRSGSLGMLAPRRISAVYLLGLFILLFGLLQPGDLPDRCHLHPDLPLGCGDLHPGAGVPGAAHRRRLRPVHRVGDGAVAGTGHLPLAAQRPAHARDRSHRGRGSGRLRGRVRLHRREAARQLVHRDPGRQPGARRRGAAAVEQHPADRRPAGLLVEPRHHQRPGSPEGRLHAAAAGAGDVVRPRVHPRSGATCWPPAATPRRRGWPACRPTACSSASSWPAA